jgi:PhoH-like ATPase
LHGRRPPQATSAAKAPTAIVITTATRRTDARGSERSGIGGDPPRPARPLQEIARAAALRNERPSIATHVSPFDAAAPPATSEPLPRPASETSRTTRIAGQAAPPEDLGRQDARTEITGQEARSRAVTRPGRARRSSTSVSSMKKNYVLDTNVLIHDPRAIFKFEDNDVIIPIYVIEEIDQFKREGTERGRNCRQVARYLDELRAAATDSLSKGVGLGDGLGTLRVAVPSHRGDLPVALDHSAQDHAILKTALDVRDHDTGKPTIFVTMDTNLRIRADALGMEAQTYENSKVDVETLDSGIVELQVEKDAIDEFFQSGQLVPKANGIKPNTAIVLKDIESSSHTALGRYDGGKSAIVPLRVPREGVMGIRPKNREQAFGLDLLLDDSIRLVSLVGKAGTGKTLLALAAGLRKVVEDGTFTRMLVSRPVMPMGRDIGYLPGDVDEKLNPWMQPIFDNLEFLYGHGKRDNAAFHELIEGGLVQVEPLTYIRGRSLPHQYLIVDEAQNLTPHEIKTIITRAGEGTKIVLTGDPHQIDNPYVDSASNGLSVVADRFRNEKIAGHVTLSKGERSELAEIAANLL